MRHQQSRWFYVAVFFLLLSCGVSPETVSAQWTTGPGNINNTNTGNVGIGTGTPPSKLTVSGGDIHVQTPTLVSNGSMGDIGFGPGGSTYGGVAPRAFMRGYFQGTHWYSGSALAFFTHSGNDITNGNTFLLERMRIDKDGNVGIGTTTPAAKLQIYNSGANSRTGISIDSQGTQNVQQAEINLFTLGDGAKDAVTAGTKGWHLAARGNAYAGAAEQNDLQLYFWNGAAAGIRQYWDAGGNVGIGTTATPSLLNLFRAGASPGAPADLITFSAPGSSGATEFNVAQILADTNGVNSNDSYLAVNPINANGTGYATGLTVRAGGNVGIGTATPVYKLDVNGEINATGLRINGAPFSGGQWTTSGSNVYYNTGNIGVGTASPVARFDVLQPNAAAIRALSGSLTTHTSIQIGRSQTEGLLGIAATASQYAVDASGGDVILRTEAADKKLLFTNGPNASTLAVASTGISVTGNVTVSGTLNAKYQDVAEWVESSQKLEAGTVVALDPSKSNQVLASSEAYDTKVAGVISAQPGLALGEGGAGKVLVATTGRVKVKVDATRAAIKIGDLLVTSDVAGVAMKSLQVEVGGVKIHRPGTLIGKALEPLEKGVGEILVLLSLQ